MFILREVNGKKKNNKIKSNLVFTRLKSYLPKASFEVAEIRVADDPRDWVVIKEQSYLPDKVVFIIDEFASKYPNVKLSNDDNTDYAMITNLASRSQKIAEWFALTSAQYALTAQMPTYLKEVINPKTYESLQKDITKFNKVNAEEQAEKQKASDKYKKELQTIEDKYKNEKQKFIKQKEIYILTLPTSKLPLSLQLNILNYKPIDDDSPNTKVYTRELLVNYKIHLLTMLRDDPNFNPVEFVDSNLEK